MMNSKYEAFVLNLHICEYEDIYKDSNTIDKMYEFLDSYNHNDYGYKRHISRYHWDYISIGSLLMLFTKYDEIKFDSIDSLIIDVINLQSLLLSIGVLVRGSLSKGSIRWMNDKFVTGEGILKSCELIDKFYSEYARILIDDNDCMNIKNRELIKNTSIVGLKYLNYLDLNAFNYAARTSTLLKMRDLIRIGLNKYSYQKSERYKQDLENYLWLKKYFENNLQGYGSMARDFIV